MRRLVRRLHGRSVGTNFRLRDSVSYDHVHNRYDHRFCRLLSQRIHKITVLREGVFVRDAVRIDTAKFDMPNLPAHLSSSFTVSWKKIYAQ